ncbi:MAG: hypothetical protein JSS65_05405 [Armatimonadetes bacterium]|nr:hypothetical protein [Armatimonadota bacterium]
MSSGLLYHFSDRDDIEAFHPRPPLRHPDTEPLVFAIDAWHSPLYFFPRDCPRIGVWPVESTTIQDRQTFSESTNCRMLLLIDQSHESSWRGGQIVRYAFTYEGFEDCHDHGVWVSRQPRDWRSRETLLDLPAACHEAGVEVRVVPSLASSAQDFYDPALERMDTTLHVSMVRMSLLPKWTAKGGRPVAPRNAASNSA